MNDEGRSGEHSHTSNPECRGSSVVERYPEEVGVVSSILTRGTLGWKIKQRYAGIV